ncbi:hypothetical protein UPYG_G00069960, partial [Umbra pygmaea]
EEFSSESIEKKEAIPAYRATHHRRLQNDPNSDRMPQVTYSSESELQGNTVKLCDTIMYYKKIGIDEAMCNIRSRADPGLPEPLSPDPTVSTVSGPPLLTPPSGPPSLTPPSGSPSLTLPSGFPDTLPPGLPDTLLPGLPDTFLPGLPDTLPVTGLPDTLPVTGLPLFRQSLGPLNCLSPGHLHCLSLGRLNCLTPGRPLSLLTPGRPLSLLTPGRPLSLLTPGPLFCPLRCCGLRRGALCPVCFLGSCFCLLCFGSPLSWFHVLHYVLCLFWLHHC